MDLSDPSERLQMAGELGPPPRVGGAVAALAQRAHEVAAEEPRPAIDRNQHVFGGACGHGGLAEWTRMGSFAGPAIQDRLPPVQTGKTRKTPQLTRVRQANT